MLIRTSKFPDHEQQLAKLSRRHFFTRIAAGAVLSIAMPGVIQAAQTKAGHRELPSDARKAVRLRKRTLLQKKSSVHRVSQVMETPAITKPSEQHSVFGIGHARVGDRYIPKKQEVVTHYRMQSQPLASIVRSTDDGCDCSVHRELAIQNPHTGDKLSLTYFEQGRYLYDALDEINFLLRDYRTGDVHPIAPELLDQLHDLKQLLGLNQAFDVICGYRSPLTNARLHAENVGVANNSFHIYGRAVDIRIEGFDLRRAHNAALAMHRGGVGYYPGSNFIHLDTGTFRSWTL